MICRKLFKIATLVATRNTAVSFCPKYIYQQEVLKNIGLLKVQNCLLSFGNSLQQNRQHEIYVQVNKYLLDRTKPASDILKCLLPEDAERLQLLQIEHTYFYNSGHEVPSPKDMRDDDWLELLVLTSKMKRMHYYQFRFKTIMKKHNDKRLKMTKVDDNEVRVRDTDCQLKQKDRIEKVDQHDGNDDLISTRIIRRLYPTNFHQFENNNLFSHLPFSQPLVIDMSFEETMRLQDVRSLSSHISYGYFYNRALRDPFHLAFCNLDPKSNQYHFLSKALGCGFETSGYQSINELPITISPNCFTNLYPKSQLIYLSADSPVDLQTWDHNAVYIVGGIVDKIQKVSTTFSKARRLGIRHARLPLDRFFQWNGSKRLNFLLMLQILSTLKDTGGDFEKAFEFISKRCRVYPNDETKQIRDYSKDKLDTRNNKDYKINKKYTHDDFGYAKSWNRNHDEKSFVRRNQYDGATFRDNYEIGNKKC